MSQRIRIEAELVEQLTGLPLMQQPSGRQQLVQELRRRLDHRVSLHNVEEPRRQSQEIVAGCAPVPAALAALVDVVVLFAPVARQIHLLRRLRHEWEVADTLLEEDWSRLRHALVAVRPSNPGRLYQLATGYQLSSPGEWCEHAWDMFVQLSGQNAPAGGLPPGMLFLLLLEQEVDASVADLIHRRNQQQANQLGLTEQLDRHASHLSSDHCCEHSPRQSFDVGISQRPARTPAIWGKIPPRNPNFTGRTELLKQLHERVRGGTTAVPPHALHGLGGVGKSHFVIQYVHLHQGEYDLIWWIPAERPAQIGVAMVELAQRIGLYAGPDAGSARTAVQEALRVGTPCARWLLIFDNAESPESLRPYLPAGGPGSILITSRNPRWSSMARTLEVDVFTREESIQLLRTRGPELDDQDADRLAEALGDLPLALEQAAAWRAETGMSAEEYLRLFSETEQRIELLAQATPMDYQLPVAAAWNVSLDQLMVSNPAAFRLLQLCSFLASDPIPRTLLGGACNVDVHPELNDTLRDPMRLNRAIRDITRYALARINYRTNSIQMHRLVQSVLQDRMPGPEQESMRDSAHRLLVSGDRNDPDTPANWPRYAELYSHLDASDAVHSTDPRVQQLIRNEAMYLYWSGEYETSLDLCQQAYDSWRAQLGQDHPATLAIGHQFGFMLYTLGRYREAAEHNRQVLAACERGTSEDTEELLRQVGAVAADLRVAGQFSEAQRMDEDLYQRHLRLLGPEDPNTLNAAHNLAVSLRLTGDLLRAYQVDQDTYEHRVLLFGEDHAHTLESHLNLVLDRRELGQYLAARNEMQEIVDRLPPVWGTERTQTLRAKRRLAAAVRKAGDHATARALSEEVRAEYAAQYGDDSPDALLAALGLAVDLRAMDQLDDAIALGELVHEHYRRLFDDEHPYTLAAALNTAIAYRLRGDLTAARRANEEGLATLTRRLGPDHPLTLGAAVNLANDLAGAGDFAAALERDQDTVERLRRVLGQEHPTTLICQANLAADMLALDRQAEAYELHAEVVSRLQEQLGTDHPATLAGSDTSVRCDCDLDPLPL